MRWMTGHHALASRRSRAQLQSRRQLRRRRRSRPMSQALRVPLHTALRVSRSALCMWCTLCSDLYPPRSLRHLSPTGHLHSPCALSHAASSSRSDSLAQLPCEFCPSRRYPPRSAPLYSLTTAEMVRTVEHRMLDQSSLKIALTPPLPPDPLARRAGHSIALTFPVAD